MTDLELSMELQSSTEIIQFIFTKMMELLTQALQKVLFSINFFKEHELLSLILIGMGI